MLALGALCQENESEVVPFSAPNERSCGSLSLPEKSQILRPAPATFPVLTWLWNLQALCGPSAGKASL